MVNINGEDWRIILTSPNHPMLTRKDGRQTIGACDNIEKAIYINEYLDNEMLKKVLCHEMVHAAMFSYDVELSLQQEELLANLFATYGQEIICTTNKVFKRIKETREL